MYDVTITTPDITQTTTVKTDNPVEAEDRAILEFEEEWGSLHNFPEFKVDTNPAS